MASYVANLARMQSFGRKTVSKLSLGVPRYRGDDDDDVDNSNNNNNNNNNNIKQIKWISKKYD
jgi:hypothetical protein